VALKVFFSPLELQVFPFPPSTRARRSEGSCVEFSVIAAFFRVFRSFSSPRVQGSFVEMLDQPSAPAFWRHALCKKWKIGFFFFSRDIDSFVLVNMELMSPIPLRYRVPDVLLTATDS